MRVFVEEQRFTQWWIFVTIAVLFVGILFPVLMQNSNGEARIPTLLALLILGGIFWLMLSLRLRTRIDNNGVTAYFSPFSFSKKRFLWNEIDKCYIRKYSAHTEFGGRGFRFKRKKRAYTMVGNQGIQIYTTTKKTFLIGTQKPIDSKTVINYYTNRKEEK